MIARSVDRKVAAAFSTLEQTGTASFTRIRYEMLTQKTRTCSAIMTSVIRLGKLRGSVRGEAFGFSQFAR